MRFTKEFKLECIRKYKSGEKRFNGLNDEQIFSLYMKEIHEFITTFDVDNYQPEKYLYGANVIKATFGVKYKLVGLFTYTEIYRFSFLTLVSQK